MNDDWKFYNKFKPMFRELINLDNSKVDNNFHP